MTVESAIAAAQQWNPPPLATRLQGLRRFAALLTHRSEDMASLITRATAKPITLSRAEVMRALLDAAGHHRHRRARCRPPPSTAGGQAPRLGPGPPPAAGGGAGGDALQLPAEPRPAQARAGARRRMRGAVRPSPQAPGVAESVRSLMTEAGIDAGAVVVCPWSNEEVEAACADHRPHGDDLHRLGRGRPPPARGSRAAPARSPELRGNAAPCHPRPGARAGVGGGEGRGGRLRPYAGQVCISVRRIFHPT